MLQSLRIRNLAIVDDLFVEFGTGLNVITGETGAGKSIIAGALNLLLGERADKSILRAGADLCTVEAMLQLDSRAAARDALNELGLENDTPDQLIIRRQLAANGTGKSFINDTPATLQALKRIGDRLVDLHGPHDHQSLLDRDSQLDLLDAFGHHHPQRRAYEKAWRDRLDLQNQLEALSNQAGNPLQQIDFLTFQIREIEQANLDGLDETELLNEHTRVANAQRILELTGAIQEALQGDDASAFSALGAAQKHLAELVRIVPEAESWRADTGQLARQTQELAHALTSFAGMIEADPDRLAWIEERMATLHRLKRKYGATLPAILDHLKNARRQLHDLETRGQRATQLEADIRAATTKIERHGRDLAKRRRAAAAKLATAITRELRDLGFANGAFDVAIQPTETPGPTGLDHIEFSFQPNPGEPARPLRAIASSGEISRVMLAVKTVLAQHDRVPVLVFDEVDANVGGEMGNAIGEKLRAVAASRQVICITHLPHVAARGQHHFVVAKSSRQNRTTTTIQPVQDEARVDELARMLGGRELTSVTLRHARELLRKLSAV